MLPPAKLQLVPISLLFFIATVPIPVPALELPFLPSFGRSLKGLASYRSSSGGDDEAMISNPPSQKPIAVRKMTDDQGEMFFPEYWSFDARPTYGSGSDLDKQKRMLSSTEHPDHGDPSSNIWLNASIPQPLQAPFSLHTNQQIDTAHFFGRVLRSPRAIFSLDKRAFQCPGDTTACTSINRPNSCCASGQTCQLITDSGLGDVGCCGNGQTCSEQVSGCQQGDTSCPGSAGGGCCVPGYTCAGVGCKSPPIQCLTA